MTDLMTIALKIALVIFMAGNLLEMGLKLRLDEARKALRNENFMVQSVLWAFVMCPALAYLLTKIIPLAEPYALGLLFLGLAPCAPFVPLVAEKARGDLAYVAAFMLLAAVGTVVLMPFMVLLLVKGFTADAWTIAKPLVFFIAIPMAIGIMIRGASETFAEKAHPIVKKVTGIDTVIMVLCIFIMYGKDFVSAIGTYAIGVQILYYVVIAVASYGLGFGLAHSQKSVLALGVSTRNIGAAIAPLFAVANTDQRAIAMCALAVPITVIIALIAARVLARRAPKGKRAAAPAA
jgi:BASS family bile acid:Na+ symporter